ncbi:MAG: hypothetical protein AB8U25_04305 [Rickettsiales endosymbiont of Dermacentor nuttalli]
MQHRPELDFLIEMGKAWTINQEMLNLLNSYIEKTRERKYQYFNNEHAETQYMK